MELELSVDALVLDPRFEESPRIWGWLGGADGPPSTAPPPVDAKGAGERVHLKIKLRPGGVYTHLHLQVLTVSFSPSSGEAVLQTSGCVCTPLAAVSDGTKLELQQVRSVTWDDGAARARLDLVHKGGVTVVRCVRDAGLAVGAPPDGHLDTTIGGLHSLERELQSWNPELVPTHGHTPAKGMKILDRLTMPFYARGETPVPAAAAILFRYVNTPEHGLLSPGTRVAVADAVLARAGIAADSLASQPPAVIAQCAAYAVSLPITSMPYWDDLVVVPGEGRVMTDRMEPMTLALSGDCDDAGPAVALIAGMWARAGLADRGPSGVIAGVLAHYVPVVATAVVSTGSADKTASSSSSAAGVGRHVMGHTTCILVRRDILVFHNSSAPAHLSSRPTVATAPPTGLPPIMFAEGTGAMIPVPFPPDGMPCVLNGASCIEQHVFAQDRVFDAASATTDCPVKTERESSSPPPSIHGLNSPFSPDGAPTFFQYFGRAVFPDATTSRPGDTKGVIEWSIHASVEDADAGVYGMGANAMATATAFVVSPLTRFTLPEVEALAREVHLGQSPEPCLFQPGEAGDRCRTTLYHIPFQLVDAGARSIAARLNTLFQEAFVVASGDDGTRVVFAYNAGVFIRAGFEDVEKTWRGVMSAVKMTARPVARVEVLSDCVINVTVTCRVAV